MNNNYILDERIDVYYMLKKYILKLSEKYSEPSIEHFKNYLKSISKNTNNIEIQNKINYVLNSFSVFDKNIEEFLSSINDMILNNDLKIKMYYYLKTNNF